MRKRIFYLVTFLLLVIFAYFSIDKATSHSEYSFGQKIDSLNGVYVFYNGSVGNVEGRNVAADGYNLGLKYQCVEFVKRYYYEYLHHKMPDSYGHAKSFFEHGISDGKINKNRNLLQFTNPSYSKPEINDLLVFDGTSYNEYGHVAIISDVFEDKIEIIQQNPGKFGESRIYLTINMMNDKWIISNDRILGWLRKE